MSQGKLAGKPGYDVQAQGEDDADADIDDDLQKIGVDVPQQSL